MIKKTLKEWCVENNRQDLLDEWDYEKNGELTPDNVSYGSHAKVYWVCNKNHSFSQTIKQRTLQGCGCPYCANCKVLKEFNDFETYCKNNNLEYILKEWDYAKNKEKGYMPSDILYSSSSKVWWLCDKNHSYDRAPHERINIGYNCPYCSNNKVLYGYNDLETWCKQNNRLDLLNEWDYEKNGDLKPCNVFPQSHKKVYWKCQKCGYSLSCRIQDKVIGKTKCRVCSNRFVVEGYNDFATWCTQNKKEYLLKEWVYEKNTICNITPQNISFGSRKKVWWICEKGHLYDRMIKDRLRGYNCPYCSNHRLLQGFNDFETWCKQNNREYLLEEWDYKKNNILPSEITARNDKKVFWKCPVGHSYKAVLNTRTRPNESHGCPECNKSNITSFPEQAILFYLEKIYNDIENSNRTLLDGRELDIYIPSIKTAIEYDGDMWHSNIDRDMEKNKRCVELGITLYRIREPGCPILTDGSSVNIELKTRNNYIELQNAIYCLFSMLKIDNIDIDIDRDECKIREKYIKFKSDKSFVELFPELVNEWDYEKNGDLTPESFSYGSGVKVWWKCTQCNYSWKSTIGNRTNGNKCPMCSKKLSAKKCMKKVLCVETNEVFCSLGEASKVKHISAGHISECCHNKRQTACGYHWKYVD